MFVTFGAMREGEGGNEKPRPGVRAGLGFCDPEFWCALTCPRLGRGDGGDGHGRTEAAGAHGHAAAPGGLTSCEGGGGKVTGGGG